MGEASILFATIAAGGGHLATANAIAEAVEQHYAGSFDLRVSDLMHELGMFKRDRQHKRFWRWALAHPQLVRSGQRILDATPTFTRQTQRIMLHRFARLAAQALGGEAPSLIVANHGWLAVGLTLAQRRFGLAVRVLSFGTEPLDASALWAEPRAERFIVPSESARNDLVRLGVGRERVDVVGYPVRRAFLEVPGQAEARRALGLPDGFTCLLSLGGEGVGTVQKTLLTGLLDRGVSVVVMAGRNQTLYERLQPLARRFEHLRVEGFTDEMATFVAASDVVVGKAGPASVFEVLAVGRPFLATGYVGLNEGKVVAFLKRHKLGGHFPSPSNLLATVLRYRECPEELEQVRERAGALELGRMTRDLARYVVHYARFGERDLRWVGRGLS